MRLPKPEQVSTNTPESKNNRKTAPLGLMGQTSAKKNGQRISASMTSTDQVSPSISDLNYIMTVC